MVLPTVAEVVLVPFPFSDLSQTKLRPAIVLADVGQGDWILCQVTSNAYTDVRAIELSKSDIDGGSLRVISYARPGKIFTANQSLIVSVVGSLNPPVFRHIIEAVVTLLQSGLSS